MKDNSMKWGVFMKLFLYLPIIGLIIILSGCTYSINLIHSEGTTSDVIDENQSATPNISPTITGIPSAI